LPPPVFNHYLPINKKIVANNENMTIIKTIISLAHNLGLGLIVEGFGTLRTAGMNKGIKV